MFQSQKRISLIIPAYNEEEQLESCLNAIARLKPFPHEVIVVNNNSTDQTAAIARRYPFVKLINEPRQGVVNARSRGFDAASGEIIGRIDVDTRLPSDWTAQVERIFVNEAIDAVSGAVGYYDLPFYRLCMRADLLFRRWLAGRLGNRRFLYGANMAIRRSAWLAVRGDICPYGGLHEDFDLALHLQFNGLMVAFDESLVASVSARRFNSKIGQFWQYAKVSPRTYARHNLKNQANMYPVLIVVLMNFWLIKLIHKSYDPVAGRLSLRQLLKSNVSRVDPTANVV